MRPNPHFPADLVTYTEIILNGKLLFLCSDFINIKEMIRYSFIAVSKRKNKLIWNVVNNVQKQSPGGVL